MNSRAESRGRNIVAAAVLVIVLAAIGCAARTASVTAETAESQSGLGAALRNMGAAPAALAVSEPMRPFFAAGLGFIVLGGLTIALGGRGTGAVLMGLGVATTATGVLFVQYPWAALVLALAAGGLAALAAWDRIRIRRELDRNRDTLEATAEVIQNIPEGKAIKAGLAELGLETENRIRQVIGPIKEKLRREGRISDPSQPQM